MVEVELVDGLTGRKPGGFDTQLPAVGLAGGDFPLEAGSEELFVGPFLGAGPFGEPLERSCHRWGFQRSTQIGHIGGGFRGLGHEATSMSWS